LIYLDSLQQQGNTLYKNFVGSVNPQKEVKIWARTFLDGDFYNSLSTYSIAHQSLNGFSGQNRNVPDDYFDALLESLTLSERMHISGNALHTYINIIHHNYAIPKILNKESNKKFRTSNGGISVPSKIMDSLSVYGIIKHTPDSLLRQFVLSELLWQH